MVLLDIVNVDVYIGNVHILRKISFNIEKGEVLGLIGPNGAGKTTTLKTIIGLLPLRTGKIVFEGEDISRLPARNRVGKGITYSPEDRRLISDLTVEENILLPCWVSGSMTKSMIEKNLEIVYKIFPEIKEFKNRKAKLISGGQQKMVSIARALVLMPKLVLLDEPFEGLAPMVANRLLRSIEAMKSLGITTIIAESNLRYVKQIADKIVRIERGEIKEVVENA